MVHRIGPHHGANGDTDGGHAQHPQRPADGRRQPKRRHGGHRHDGARHRPAWNVEKQKQARARSANAQSQRLADQAFQVEGFGIAAGHTPGLRQFGRT